MNARWKALVACLMLMLANRAAQASVQETVKYIHTDALGSIVAVTNANGQVIERRAYEPYGAQLLADMQDGPGYTGHVQDAATGLVYMQQRYYDPQIGRFLSVDPVEEDQSSGDNFNRYWYARNNPYRFADPDGRLACNIGKICPNSRFESDPFKRYALSDGGGNSLDSRMNGSSDSNQSKRGGELSFFRLTTFEVLRRDTSIDKAVQAGELTRTVTMPAIMVSASPGAAGLAGTAFPAAAPTARAVHGMARSKPFREGVYHVCIGIQLCNGERPSTHRLNFERNVSQARDGAIRESRRKDVEVPMP